MIDNIIKCLPIFLAIVPFFVWIDKSKRFSHRRKFYLNRLEAISVYIENYYNNKDISKVEKDCAAQALACSDKIGHLEVDYVIETCPHKFFFIIKKLTRIKFLIDTVVKEEKIFLSTRSSKNNYKKKRIILFFSYISSIFIISINHIFVFLIDWLGVFKPFYVESWVLNLGLLILIFIGGSVAIISGILFFSIDILIEIYDDLKLSNLS
ncbi:hypothetical protein ACIN5162_1044 [Acinetobacter baumannii OIFC0162]|uniref:hypothetical protein n=1 Tax=Acinetobacter TaxID=469 RepID=UPI00028C9108|nr:MULTISPECIES: hypothetical protein [Acinetobacter]EHU1601904.1 hypothetical protein [Acinetobacter baumannii]EHU2431843.1 hypothetical protein [Acinetobacter baumannii]EHU2606260.1 hypothetical protein [Acinetobacter baumannii]EHU2649582.1 hypothetical protein [Acinetobacter baumannii]EIB6857553.1 hypothetical protein [Acinetobacter baumannii]